MVRLHIRVGESSLERCRWRAFDALDERLAAIVAGTPIDAGGTPSAIDTGKHVRTERKRKL